MERYFSLFAAAFVRGAALRNPGIFLPESCESFTLDGLTENQLDQIIHTGELAGLKMYHFKRKELLPRVKVVLGFLRGIQPGSLLDVGSGRGVFLLPFLSEFPWTQVTCLDVLPHRAQMFADIAAGGVTNLTALQGDICSMDAEDNTYEVVTMLEVLEHIPDVQSAVNAAVRLAQKYVVVTVPSKPDNNPEHIHLLTKDKLTTLFRNAGCTRLHFDGVPGHLYLIARKG